VLIWVGLDKKSSIFEGIEKLEETQEQNRFRYTSGKEKEFDAIVPYYENAKQKGFKDAAVIGFVNDNIGIGQAKNLKAILFDSASVEKQALKVYFKYNIPTYESKYDSQLDSLLKKAGNLEEQKVLLITHVDGLGSLDYNMNLNTQRTNNMINYLIKKGVKRQLIKTEFIIHPTENLTPDLLRRIEVFLQH
jgi:outer membrane protein OmpA-like peptidoglycan-associated protein